MLIRMLLSFQIAYFTCNVVDMRKQFYLFAGIGSLSSKMNTLSGIKMTNEKIFPYLSTSHYLRNAAGTEKAGRYEDHPGGCLFFYL